MKRITLWMMAIALGFSLAACKPKTPDDQKVTGTLAENSVGPGSSEETPQEISGEETDETSEENSTEEEEPQKEEDAPSEPIPVTGDVMEDFLSGAIKLTVKDNLNGNLAYFNASIELSREYSYEELLQTLTGFSEDEGLQVVSSSYGKLEPLSIEGNWYCLCVCMKDMYSSPKLYLILQEQDDALILSLVCDSYDRTETIVSKSGLVEVNCYFGTEGSYRYEYAPNENGEYILIQTRDITYNEVVPWMFEENSPMHDRLKKMVKRLDLESMEDCPVDYVIGIITTVGEDTYYEFDCPEKDFVSEIEEFAAEYEIKNSTSKEVSQAVKQYATDCLVDERYLDDNASKEDFEILVTKEYEIVDAELQGEQYTMADMKGIWKCVAVEVEGSVEKPEEGRETRLTIKAAAGDDYICNYKDVRDGEVLENILSKKLIYCDYPLYEGCGNDAWSAMMNYSTDDENEAYYLAIIDENTVVVQHFFTLGEGMGVGYYTFERDE